MGISPDGIGPNSPAINSASFRQAVCQQQLQIAQEQGIIDP